MSGVHSFLTTPFHTDYRFNAEGLRHNVTFHVQVSSEQMIIVVAGGLEELFTLNVEEHTAVTDAAVADVQGNLPVVVGVGGGYANALQMAKNVEKAETDAVLLFAYRSPVVTLSPLTCSCGTLPVQFALPSWFILVVKAASGLRSLNA